MSYLSRAADMIFETKVIEDLGGGKGRQRTLNPNLIVMSHHTAREIMREDRGGSFRHAMVKTEPDRLFMARVAYDDSMGPGEMMVAEAKGDIG